MKSWSRLTQMLSTRSNSLNRNNSNCSTAGWNYPSFKLFIAIKWARWATCFKTRPTILNKNASNSAMSRSNWTNSKLETGICKLWLAHLCPRLNLSRKKSQQKKPFSKCSSRKLNKNKSKVRIQLLILIIVKTKRRLLKLSEICWKERNNKFCLAWKSARNWWQHSKESFSS